MRLTQTKVQQNIFKRGITKSLLKSKYNYIGGYKNERKNNILTNTKRNKQHFI